MSQQAGHPERPWPDCPGVSTDGILARVCWRSSRATIPLRASAMTSLVQDNREAVEQLCRHLLWSTGGTAGTVQEKRRSRHDLGGQEPVLPRKHRAVKDPLVCGLSPRNICSIRGLREDHLLPKHTDPRLRRDRRSTRLGHPSKQASTPVETGPISSRRRLRLGGRCSGHGRRRCTNAEWTLRWTPFLFSTALPQSRTTARSSNRSTISPMPEWRNW